MRTSYYGTREKEDNPLSFSLFLLTTIKKEGIFKVKWGNFLWVDRAILGNKKRIVNISLLEEDH